MDQNPYNPPATALADPAEPARGPRPLAVTCAVILMSTSLIFGLFENAGLFRRYLESDLILPLKLFAVFFGPIVCAWLYYKLWVGRNWARIALLILIVISVPVIIANFPHLRVRAPVIIGLHFLARTIELLAMYLVFFPGRRWYVRQQP